MTTLTLAKTDAVKVDSKLRIVTPENAKFWLESSIWSNQRKFREYHAERLAEAMRRNEFIEGTQIHFAKLDGVIHNVNGHHTLHAIVKANKAIQLSVLTTVVKSEKEIADLYGRHDQHMKRTVADSYRAQDFSNRFGLSDHQVSVVGSAVKVIIDGFKRVDGKGSAYINTSLDERTRVFESYGDAAKSFIAAVSGAPLGVGKTIKSAFVAAVALETFKHSPDKAREFWSQVAFGDGLKIGDPRKTLTDWLVSNPSTRTNAVQRSRVAAHAWNVFVAGGTCQNIRSGDWTKPIQINIA